MSLLGSIGIHGLPADSKVNIQFTGDRCALFDKESGNKIGLHSLELI